MKNFISCYIALFFISIISSGQNISVIDTSKYKINLPDYWKPGNKIWQILNDKLPLVCEELKGKELCGDNCNPKYSIEFIISEPFIYDYYSNHISSGKDSETWEFVTMYSFTSSFLLVNEKKELLTRFILVDTNEVWRVTHKAQLASYTAPPPQKIYMLNNPGLIPGDPQLWNSTGTAGQSPYAYINKNKDNLSPTRRDMLSIIDGKIRSW